MTSYRILNNQLLIKGIKLDSSYKPVIAARVQLVNEDCGLQYGNTTTNNIGYWELTLDPANVPSGRYVIKFIGSGTKQYIQPLGDWERIDILKDDVLSPSIPEPPLPPLTIELIMAGGVSANTVEIICVTNRATNGVIHMGTAPNTLDSIYNYDTFTMYHDKTIIGLILDQDYYFQITVTDIYGTTVTSDIYTFYTSTQYTTFVTNKLRTYWTSSSFVKSIFNFALPSSLTTEVEETSSGLEHGIIGVVNSFSPYTYTSYTFLASTLNTSISGSIA